VLSARVFCIFVCFLCVDLLLPTVSGFTVRRCGKREREREREVGRRMATWSGAHIFLFFLLLACICISLSCAEVIFEERFEG